MKCSEVIGKLNEILETDGDLPVYLCQICAEDEGELTLVEGVEMCVLGNPERTPGLIRIMDWVD